MATTQSSNRFALIIAAIVVVALLAVGGVVVFLNNQSTTPGAVPQSDIIDTETGAITFGSGNETIDTYLDFMCPGCLAFESRYGQALQDAASADTITLSVHPVAILNRASQGTEYSTRSASAMYCVAVEEPASALDFLNLVFANQPQEASPGLSDEQLVAIAEKVGASAASGCITQHTYADYADEQTTKIPANAAGQVGTPTVLHDGEYIDSPNSNADFAAFVAGLAG